MSYGNTGEYLNEAEGQIKKARKKLRKLYKFVKDFDDETHFLSEVRKRLLAADLELLEAFSLLNDKDKMCADGIKRNPKWLDRDKKLSERIAGVLQ